VPFALIYLLLRWLVASWEAPPMLGTTMSRSSSFASSSPSSGAR
jgi:hypothetical protein